MSENYNGMSIGVFELDNFVACFVALDAAANAANLIVPSIVRKRFKSGSCVIISASVSDVIAAMEVALETAKPLGYVVSHRILASPISDTQAPIKMTINN